jgi:flagellar hook-length control protein FliK
MEAVTLPIQLTAQMLAPGGDAAAVDAASAGIPGQAGMPVFFAALLAQQLGMSVDGQLGKEGEVVDVEVDPDVDTALIAGANADAVDALGQLQQGFVGLPILPSVSAVTTTAPEEDLAAMATSAQGVGILRGSAGGLDIVRGPAGGLDIAEEVAAGRQSIAANSAAFAEVTAHANFSASSESFAEQAMRPVMNGAQPVAVATPPVAGAIAQPVSNPAWGEVLGDRVMWMVGQQQQGAELRLNPPTLGPLEIKLSMSDGQATLTFSTQHMPVKEALEAATPRLREMFGESGINLGSVSVNLGSASQQQGEQQQASRHSQEWGQAQPESDFTSMLPTAVTSLGRNGMVDFFA